ncbi:TRAP transporter small permease subunit [bacterium]|nr:TRAP transporter small permease subunit [bacterium]
MRALLARLEERVAGLLLAAITLLICAQLVLASAAPTWASPLSTLILALFFWCTLLGIPAATRRRAHLCLIFVRRHIPERWQLALRVAGLVAALVFFGILAVTGTRLGLNLARWGNSFLGTACPDWVVTVAVPVSAVLSCVRSCQAWRQAETEGAS